MPKTSEENLYYTVFCGNYEAYAHMMIATSLDFTEESKKGARIEHFKKARAIYNLVDMKDNAKLMDTAILGLTAKKQGTNKLSMLLHMKNSYESHL
jgi:hypothetical protein